MNHHQGVIHAVEQEEIQDVYQNQIEEQEEIQDVYQNQIEEQEEIQDVIHHQDADHVRDL